jgi:DUF971 family protein
MVEPLQIIEESDSAITIAWSDGRESLYNAPDLRRKCPCAGCVNEWTGERMLKPETIAENLSLKNIAVVGRYALNFNFSDGHETGIYSFKYLRELSDGGK